MRHFRASPPPADSVFVIYGRAHRLILPHPANPDTGTRWTPKPSGGGKLDLVLARDDQPSHWVCPRFEVYPEQGKIGPDEPTSWLVANFNPTTILTGNNVLPATIADPETGEFNEVPSSDPPFLMTAYRIGFDLLTELAQQAGLITGELFSRRTLLSIENGDVHVVRSQWAGYLAADVPAFLQLLAVLYDQTIAHKKEIIQLATHLGLEFTRYPPTGRLTGVNLVKRQGNKRQYSVSFYDKAVHVAQMRQGRSLTKIETETVRRHVRVDVTVHSAGILTLIGEARRRLPQLLAARPKYLAASSAQRFMTEPPRPTVWWLERAIWILSRTTPNNHSRRSFGSWLIPEMLREVLRLHCIAGFTAADLHALLRQRDEVVAAWRRAERAEDDWAGALAQAAQCSKGWVYERRKQLLAKHKIYIALPFAFYRDLIFYGPNSVTKPQDRAALNAALARGDAATNLRLRQQAAKDFDRQCIGVAGASVRAPALLMSPKVAIEPKAQPGAEPAIQSVAPREPNVGAVNIRGSAGAKGNPPGALNLRGGTHAGTRVQGADVGPITRRPELDQLPLDFDDVDLGFQDVDLVEAVPRRPVSARPVTAPSSARSNPPQIRSGLFRPHRDSSFDSSGNRRSRRSGADRRAADPHRQRQAVHPISTGKPLVRHAHRLI